MISFNSKGDFSKTIKYITKVNNIPNNFDFTRFGEKGINALQKNSPVDTGLLKSSWTYSINRRKNGVEITWYNKDIEDGSNVAILVQYGHSTKSGTFVKGVDFVNPAMKPIFDEIANDLLKEVINS